MSYRNLTVKDREFRYVIGRTHIKIQEPSKKSHWVAPRSEFTHTEVCTVGPGNIRWWILNNVFGIKIALPEPKCGCGERNKAKLDFTTWPFDSEIYGKHHFAWICEKCYHQSEMDI